MENKKIIQYKKPFRPRVATLILCIIIVYVAVVAWNYFSKEHISIYEVNETSIADDSTITGFITREETVVAADKSGYVNFYHADQSKVGKNEVIYTIDSTGAVNELLSEVETGSATTAGDITKLREVIQDYYVNYNPAAFYKVRDFHYSIENSIFEQSRNNLYSDLKKRMSEKDIKGDFVRARAKTSGIISYCIDGYEGTKADDVTADFFEKGSEVGRTLVRSSEKIEAGTPVYKLVTNEEWNIVIPVSDSLYEKIKESSTLKITVKKDNVSFPVDLSLEEHGGYSFAVLSSSRFMERYLSDRFLDIELNLNAASGFKIPNSSILTKELTLVPENLTEVGGNGEEKGVIKVVYDEKGGSKEIFTSLKNSSVSDGKYCVDPSVLKPGDVIKDPADDSPHTLRDVLAVDGVYCANTGYCQFKKIEKIYENNEYTIISPDTRGGISNFDHIIVNPDKINEDDFVDE